MTLSLLGTGKCTWTVKSKNASKTYRGSEEYVIIHLDLLKTQKALEIGAYEYPFEFFLPETLPSSFKDSVCTIAYKIQLEFEKVNFFSFNETFSTDITVQGCSYVEPTVEGPVVFGLEKTLLKLFSAKKNVINLKTEIAKTFIIPGENVQLTSVVTNDTDVAPLVRAELFCFTKYTADCGTTKTSNIEIKNTCSDIIEVPAYGKANISQIVPISPSLNSITTKVMLKEYRVRVTIRLPLPHVNAFVEMPVLLGKRKGMPLDECSEALEENGTSASSVTPEEDAPPSYWEAMCEDEVISDKT